jgi:hypothetical protein
VRPSADLASGLAGQLVRDQSLGGGGLLIVQDQELGDDDARLDGVDDPAGQQRADAGGAGPAASRRG